MAFSYRQLTDKQRETLRAVQQNGRKQPRTPAVDELIELGLVVQRQDRLVLTSRAYSELRILSAA